MKSVQIDLNNVCRTCKNKSRQMNSLYYRHSESDKKDPRLDEMLMACASVQVNNEDGLPKSICQSCFVQLKNAYSFKEQCEKTDSFLRDYLSSFRKQTMKDEIITDMEFTSNFIGETTSTLNDIGQINNDESIENINADLEQHSGESREKDVDYVEIIANNLTIYNCRTCLKTFYTLEDLRSHKQVHTGRIFKCKQCNKSYRKVNHLHRHERSHGKRKVHVCKICNKTLTCFKHLKQHLVTHLKRRPFGCPTCHCGFNRAQHLKNHVKFCKGEKAYVCNICNKGFNREDSLEVHKLFHENEKPVLRTLEDLGNIEEHYTEIYFDDNTTAFSDHSDGGCGDELDVAEEIIESEVEVSENNDQEKIDEIAQIANEIYDEEDPPEMIEKAEIVEDMYRVNDEAEAKEEEAEVDNGNEYESDDSTHSECLPTKPTPPKIKCFRGFPPVTFKPTGKHLNSLRKQGVKEQITTDVEFTSNFIARINDDHGTENKNDGAESHSDEARIKDVDYVRVADNNLTIYECRVLLEDLRSHKRIHTDNNILDYMKMDIDDNTITCSHQSDGGGGGGDDLVVNEENVKLEVKTSENNDQKKNDETVRIANGIYVEEDPPDMLGETKTEVEVNRVADEPEDDNGNGYQSDASTHSEYLQKNQTPPKIKRDRIRLRKHKIGNFSCPQCKEVFTEMRLLEKHAEQHDGLRIHECESCNKKFRTWKGLRRHKLSHREVKPYQCMTCRKPFTRRDLLQKHMKVHLSMKDRPRGHSPLLELKTKAPENKIGNFPCPQCKEVFTKRSFLEKHAEQHDGHRIHECDICSRKFCNWSNLRRHKLLHEEVEPFTRKDNLEKHMKVHDSVDGHSCDLCRAVFSRPEDLAKHKASKHNIVEKVVREEKYECQYCKKSFTDEKYRDSHMKCHFGDTKFQCKTCEKTFISESNLTKHIKFHCDSSKKFFCSECGKLYNRKDCLAVHVRTHTRKKRCKCKFCGKRFPSKADLTVHETYHTDEKRHLCVICGIRFVSAFILTVHMRIHTGEKSYRCTYCDDVFRHGSDLKAHVRKHTGERFQCELCPKTFNIRCLLTQHKGVAHGLDIVSNKSSTQSINKLNPDDSPTVTDSDTLELTKRGFGVETKRKK